MLVQVVWLTCTICEKRVLLSDCRLYETDSKDVFNVVCPTCPHVLAEQTIYEMPRKVILAYAFKTQVELRTTYNLPGAV
ncbi:hypothetical protein LCGC14_0847980 [marine sediment metagenome]|uniref:Uncharacterized protein n=1 Tax=marine sediment metagenome TaxID=412755 RepID=A0A0F9PWE3_9ZZZZ